MSVERPKRMNAQLWVANLPSLKNIKIVTEITTFLVDLLIDLCNKTLQIVRDNKYIKIETDLTGQIWWK